MGKKPHGQTRALKHFLPPAKPTNQWAALDEAADKLITDYGVGEVIAALARVCKERGMIVLSRKLMAVFDWLKG